MRVAAGSCAAPRLERAAKSALRSALMAAAAALLASCASAPPPAPAPAAPPAAPALPGLTLRAATFGDLPGWHDDNFADLWGAWQRDCKAAPAALTAACAASGTLDAGDVAAQRRFFEAWFQPWQALQPGGADSGLVTGYYEPVFKGALQPGWPFVVPLYGTPADLVDLDVAAGTAGTTRGRALWRDGQREVVPFWSRAEIDTDPQAQALLARNVVAWLASPVDALFLQVQGSGLVELPDGRLLRLSYAADNGWPYKSVGRWLLDQGELRGTVSMDIIRAWAQMHPERVPQMLDANPRVVFFRSTPLQDAARGPVGALGVPLTPLRSVAVDRHLLALGTPLWLSTTVGTQPLQHLVFAQDVGGAIAGPLRTDLFFGTGDAAGSAAGSMQAGGRIWLLLPRTTSP
jgi:membrane-bound lytic murein transglycosylase A